MSLLTISEELTKLSSVGLVSRAELSEALCVAIGEIPGEYRDAVVNKIWNECFRMTFVSG